MDLLDVDEENLEMEFEMNLKRMEGPLRQADLDLKTAASTTQKQLSSDQTQDRTLEMMD